MIQDSKPIGVATLIFRLGRDESELRGVSVPFSITGKHRLKRPIDNFPRLHYAASKNQIDLFGTSDSGRFKCYLDIVITFLTPLPISLNYPPVVFTFFCNQMSNQIVI